MIVLDTNVISEMTKQAPSSAVQFWLNDQPFEALYITTVTLAEIRFGIMAMPAGKRRDFLASAMDRTEQLYSGRILSFDQEAARRYAELATFAKARGKGFPTPDGYIGAIAAASGFIIATRDISPFKAAGLKVVNPWDSAN
jgi:predicted nucleic acid-binding protein